MTATVEAELHTYRVYYPGGSSPRIIHATCAEDAEHRAQLRWGTPPAHIELKEEE